MTHSHNLQDMISFPSLEPGQHRLSKKAKEAWWGGEEDGWHVSFLYTRFGIGWSLPHVLPGVQWMFRLRSTFQNDSGCIHATALKALVLQLTLCPLSTRPDTVEPNIAINYGSALFLNFLSYLGYGACDLGPLGDKEISISLMSVFFLKVHEVE